MWIDYRQRTRTPAAAALLICFRTAAADCRHDASIPGSCTLCAVHTAMRSPHARKRHQLWQRPGPCVESGARINWCGRALTEHARAEEECLACTIEWDLCATSLASMRRHGLTGKRRRWGAFE